MIKRAQLALELIGLAGDHADARDQLECHPDASGALFAAKTAGDAIKRCAAVQAAGWNLRLEFWAEVNQMPAQAVDLPCALAHQVGAVIGQESNLKRSFIQKRGREALHALLEDRARYSPGIDLIGLARLALTAPKSAHHLGRNTQNPLACSDQGLLEVSSDVPAVLD